MNKGVLIQIYSCESNRLENQFRYSFKGGEMIFKIESVRRVKEGCMSVFLKGYDQALLGLEVCP